MATKELLQKRPENSITWEDPEILLNALTIQAKDRVFMLAGAGDSAFSFLCSKANEVVAAVSEPIQGYLFELKKMAIQEFDHDECVEFFGFEECSVRLLMYQHLEDKISPEAKEYWGDNLAFIDQGIMHCGSFEYYLHLFNSKILPLIHSSKTIAHLFETKSEEEQLVFYTNVWKSRLWKLFFTLYFGKRSFGKHPHFEEFEKLNKENFSDHLYQLMGNHLSSKTAQNNEFLHYMFTGSSDTFLPFYLREENYNHIKNRLSDLKITYLPVLEYLKSDNDFSFIHLGESAERMENNEFSSFANQLKSLIKKSTVITHWNVLSNHSFAENDSDAFHSDKALAESFMKQDKLFFHTRFNIENKIVD